MTSLQLVLLLDKTGIGVNSILPIVSYRNISLSEIGMSVHGISHLNTKCYFYTRNVISVIQVLRVEHLWYFFWMSWVV